MASLGGVVAKARQDGSLLPELNVKERETFGFVGCGRVGRTLAQAFANTGRAVTAAWSRRATDAEMMVSEVPGLRALPSAQAVADACEALGAEWDKRTTAGRDEFARVFADVLERAYREIVQGQLPRYREPSIRVIGEDVTGGRQAVGSNGGAASS